MTQNFSNFIWKVSTSRGPQCNTGRHRWSSWSVTTVTHIYITPAPRELFVVLWHVCMTYVHVCAFPVVINRWPIGVVEGYSVDKQWWRSQSCTRALDWWSWDVSGSNIFCLDAVCSGREWDLQWKLVICGVHEILVWVV
jgi:hypothetical protein